MGLELLSEEKSGANTAGDPKNFSKQKNAARENGSRCLRKICDVAKP
jgi:hypothetical protein